MHDKKLDPGQKVVFLVFLVALQFLIEDNLVTKIRLKIQ